MPAIVRSVLVVCVLAVSLGADAHDDIMELVTSMAGALTEVNIPQFMAAFDKSMPDYEQLKANVTGLVDQAEVSSDVEPLMESGSDQKRTIELDWLLQVRSLAQDGPIVRRRQIVHCELEKINKHWKIVSIKPLNFFAPAKLAP